MTVEFTEHDLNTPTEQDLDLAYGSKYLSAIDVGDRKIRTKIIKVRKEDLRAENGKTRTKFVLFLEGIDKPMVLNATNKDELVDKLGRTPAKWINASIGIYVDPNVTFAGKRVKGLRLRVFGPAVGGAGSPPSPVAAPKPSPKPAPGAAENPWPEEKGDPGFEPDSNDDVSDVTAA